MSEGLTSSRFVDSPVGFRVTWSFLSFSLRHLSSSKRPDYLKVARATTVTVSFS